MIAGSSHVVTLALVVRKVDNAFRRINRYPVDKCYKTNHAIRWKMIHPGDNVLHLSNNQRQEEREGVHAKAKSRCKLNLEALLTFLSTYSVAQSPLRRYLIYCVSNFYNFRYTRHYPASSWFLLRQTREKLLRTTVRRLGLTAVQRQGRIN